MDKRRAFEAEVQTDGRGRVFVGLPFDPDEAWGEKQVHRVRGQVAGAGVRGTLEAIGGGPALALGATWRRGASTDVGDRVRVELEPEGPQRGDLAPDVAAALEAAPEAGRFFDALPQFYRRAYLAYIDATKRRPEQRPVRIAEVVALLAAGVRERPRP